MKLNGEIRLIKYVEINICRTRYPYLPRAGRSGAADGGATRRNGIGQVGMPMGRFAQKNRPSFPPEHRGHLPTTGLTAIFGSIFGSEDRGWEEFFDARGRRTTWGSSIFRLRRSKIVDGGVLRSSGSGDRRTPSISDFRSRRSKSPLSYNLRSSAPKVEEPPMYDFRLRRMGRRSDRTQGGGGMLFFPDMPCMKKVYRDKKASVHWSAARNEERPSSRG